MRRYYEVLDCSEDATPEQIKKAYRRMSSKLHPDKIQAQRTLTPEDTAAFQEVIKAYECLSDPERRVIYDENGTTGDEEDPVDGVLQHILMTLLEAGVPTATDLIGTIKQALESMIEETILKIAEFKQNLSTSKKIKENLEYKGKAEKPVVLVMIDEHILTLEQDIIDHEKALAGGKMAFDRMKEYVAKDKSAKPKSSRAPKDYRVTEVPEHLRMIDSMLRGEKPR